MLKSPWDSWDSNLRCKADSKITLSPFKNVKALGVNTKYVFSIYKFAIELVLAIKYSF